MMINKRKLGLSIISSLSLIAAISLVGSGFALWQFNEGNAYSNIILDNLVAPGYEIKVHHPNLFVLESDMGNISTYGGLAFYQTDKDSHYDEFHNIEDEKLYSSVIIGVTPLNSDFSSTIPFSIKMNIYLVGFVSTIINYQSEEVPSIIYGENLAINENNIYSKTYSYLFDSSSFHQVNEDFFHSTPLSFDGLFLFNQNFDQYRDSESKQINVPKLKGAMNSYYQKMSSSLPISNLGLKDGIGQIVLSFEIIES